MKFFFKDKQAYSAMTLVELVIAISVSSIILLIIGSFLTASVDSITENVEKTAVLDEVFDIKQELNILSRGGYSVFEVIYDGNSNEDDIVLLRSIAENRALVFTSVDGVQRKINSLVNPSNTYSQKYFAYAELTTNQINSIDALDITDPNYTQDLNLILEQVVFFPDKIFFQAPLKNLQTQLYNEASIVDFYFEVLWSYKTDFTGKSWENIGKDDIFRFSITL